MSDHLTPEHIQRYREQLTVNIERSEIAHRDFLGYRDEEHQDLTLEVSQPPITRHMPSLSAEAELLLGSGEAVEQRQETRSERKQREKMEKQRRKAREAARKADELEGSERTRVFRASQLDQLNNEGSVTTTMSREAYKQEQAVLEARLNAIEQKELADIKEAEMAGQVDEVQEKQIRLNAQEARVQAYHTIATQMPLGSKQRTEMMEKKEEAVLAAGLLRQELKVARMPAGTEKERDSATIKRHARFDFLKKIFRTPSAYSHEDASVTLANGKTLINAGRATLGGTKAMYVFEDRTDLVNDEPQQWLFKEATNCIGMSKPEGAIVTGEAAQLQRILRGDLSIPAQCLRDEQNKVVGSIQKKMQKAEGGVDLFRWQAQSELTALPQTTMEDLMNEHTLDWMLCNFDTKGENFINQPNDHIISFDKEASFNTLLQDGSVQMSYTFKPHSNDTIYNTMFQAYAQGRLDLDLNANLQSIQRMESIPADDFINMFKDTLDTKYGIEGADRERAEEVLRDRHRNLRKEYRTFYGNLIKERLAVTRDPNERENLQSMLVEGTFKFADEVKV